MDHIHSCHIAAARLAHSLSLHELDETIQPDAANLQVLLHSILRPVLVLLEGTLALFRPQYLHVGSVTGELTGSGRPTGNDHMVNAKHRDAWYDRATLVLPACSLFPTLFRDDRVPLTPKRRNTINRGVLLYISWFTQAVALIIGLRLKITFFFAQTLRFRVRYKAPRVSSPNNLRCYPIKAKHASVVLWSLIGS